MTNTQSSTKAVPVTADNFIRAETDKIFAGIVKMGGFGKFAVNRDFASLDNQVVHHLPQTSRVNLQTPTSPGIGDRTPA
jgi:hypothetical protein